MNRDKLVKLVTKIKKKLPIVEFVETFQIILVTVLVTFLMLAVCHWLLTGKFGILYYQFWE